ncbi:MAG TPA: V-type ATP synthase subunit D [Thermoanaerobaculia bacterium]|nr:V-type ATP synthase subunit D [Thermoanaerobaculia bacterium]
MISSSSRSRLYELRRDLAAARRGADLLERKREVLLRETSRRASQLETMRIDVREQLTAARKLLRIAEVELGREGVAAAGLAQPLSCTFDKHDVAVMGVRFKEVRAKCQTYRPVYGPAGTRASLDKAGAAFSALLPLLVEVAAEETALARLRMAVRKATKIVNALQKFILPQLESRIHTIVASIEEEERDEAVRRKMRIAAHATSF